MLKITIPSESTNDQTYGAAAACVDNCERDIDLRFGLVFLDASF